MYILLTGSLPFYDEDEYNMKTAICTSKFDETSQAWNELSLPAQHLIKSLLQVDPKKRITAQQLVEHPWLSVNQVPRKKFKIVGAKPGSLLWDSKRVTIYLESFEKHL